MKMEHRRLVREPRGLGELPRYLSAYNRPTRDGLSTGSRRNGGAYTHMPIALHDAIKGAHVPVIELHISDVRARPSVTIPGSLPRRAR